jgi:hypothetical protein
VWGLERKERRHRRVERIDLERQHRHLQQRKQRKHQQQRLDDQQRQRRLDDQQQRRPDKQQQRRGFGRRGRHAAGGQHPGDLDARLRRRVQRDDAGRDQVDNDGRWRLGQHDMSDGERRRDGRQPRPDAGVQELGWMRVQIFYDGQMVASYATDDSGKPESLLVDVMDGHGPAVYGAGSAVLVDYVRAWQ